MKRFARIAPVLFLCIYGLILMHNALPHQHSEDDVSAKSELAHHHGHAHNGHHHDHHHPKASSSKGFLGFILDFLGGSDHHEAGSGHFTWHIEENGDHEFNIVESMPLIAPLPELSLNNQLETPVEYFLFPPPEKPKIYLLADISLRGPPSIS